MTAEPQMQDDPSLVHDPGRACPDCGGPIEPDIAADKPAPVCNACYDVYVHNAGRW